MPYLQPTHAAGRALIARGIAGSVLMLNLLRFREIVDYSATLELAPAEPISGAEAFNRYIAETLPHLRASGGELLLLCERGPFLIGPDDERWNMMLLVRQWSVDAFIAFSTTPSI